MATSPGDFTGKQKAKLQKEAEERQQEEASRLSMITAQEQKTKSNEVIDYTQKREKVRKQETGPGTQADPEPVDLSEGGDHREVLTTATGSSSPEPVKDEVIDTSRGDAVQPVVVEKRSVLVRARYDLPQVTIGHGNHYDFEAGRRYRISQDAAIQLSERDLIDILE